MAEDTTFFKRQSAKLIAYRIAIVWFVLFSVNALGTSILGVLAGKYWTQFDPQDKFVAVVAVVVNWTSLLMAFLSRAAQQVNRGELPISGSAPPETKP